MAEAVHELLGACAGAGGEGARAALVPGEAVAVRPRLGVGVEVTAKVVDEGGGDGEGAASGVGLGWADEVDAVAVELALLAPLPGRTALRAGRGSALRWTLEVSGAKGAGDDVVGDVGQAKVVVAGVAAER